MVRYEDPPGAVKHLRFGNHRPELLAALKDFPGVKCVVLHTHGKKGEHPHLHVWWEGENVTNQTVRNRLKRHNESIFGACKSQNDWSMRNHDSWEQWANYVCSNMSHEVLIEYRDIAEVSSNNNLPVAVGPLHNNPPPAIVITRKNQTMRQKFIYYLQNEIGWNIGSRNPLPEEVIKHAIDFWEGGFTNPEGVRMCRHALYMFSDEIGRQQLTNRITQKIMYDL